MKPTARRLIAVWMIGVVVGTAWIGVTSPLFVRTYAPLHADSVRGVWTLPPDTTYRWRSEGYADTRIGPLGMPGKSSLPTPVEGQIRVALWGDSQAEGVCVADDEKIFAIAEQLSNGSMEVFPLARSGEDAADWLTQFSAVEETLDVDAHVLLIVDLPDLLAADQAPVDPPSESDVAQARTAVAAVLPAFVIQAARNLLTQDDGVTRRQLRFSLGPDDDRTAIDSQHNGLDRGAIHDRGMDQDWSTSISEISRTADRPVFILYAPNSPQIIAGKVVARDSAADDFSKVQTAAERFGVEVIDVRSQLLESAATGSWPHGFHNGLIGSGHLNATGNRITAAALVDAISIRFMQGN